MTVIPFQYTVGLLDLISLFVTGYVVHLLTFLPFVFTISGLQIDTKSVEMQDSLAYIFLTLL